MVNYLDKILEEYTKTLANSISSAAKINCFFIVGPENTNQDISSSVLPNSNGRMVIIYCPENKKDLYFLAHELFNFVVDYCGNLPYPISHTLPEIKEDQNKERRVYKQKKIKFLDTITINLAFVYKARLHKNLFYLELDLYLGGKWMAAQRIDFSFFL